MDIELALIGAAIVSNGGIVDEANVAAEDFFEYAHQQLWSTILKQVAKNDLCDTLTLIKLLPKQAELIYGCVDACYSVELAIGYAKQVKDAALARRIKDLGRKLVESSVDPNELIDFAQAEVNAVAETQSVDDGELMADSFAAYFPEIGKKQNNPTTGLKLLDSLLNGFKPGALYIVGARPAVGKSVLALQFAWGLSRNANDLPEGEKAGLVAFYSLEMSKRELMNRLMANIFEIPLQDFEQGNINQAQKNLIAQYAPTINRMFTINDNGGQSLSSIRAYARSFQRKGIPLKAIVIDYLGLISDANEGRSRYEAITLVSAALKRLAKELNVPVIALAQLNRAIESRGDKEPTLADLRDSGSIEQDADVVMLLHRDSDVMRIVVAKNRHGQTGLIKYKFEGQFSRVIPMPENYYNN